MKVQPLFFQRVHERSGQLDLVVMRGKETVFLHNNCIRGESSEKNNKRSIEDAPLNNKPNNQTKGQNTEQAYAAGNCDEEPYEGLNLDVLSGNFNHYGPCTQHALTATTGTQANGLNNCPQWKNKNQGNGSGVARAYADKKFSLSTQFSALINIAPTTLDHGYNVELADGRIIWVNTIPKVQFLGHVIDNKGIHVDPAKIESVKDWASPKTPTEIRQFLGLAGYYRRFIEGFSKIAKPMTKLTQKKVKFEWGDKQDQLTKLKPDNQRTSKKRMLEVILIENAKYPEANRTEKMEPRTDENPMPQWQELLTFYHASIKAAPFEALYGRKCRSPVCWAEVGEVQLTGPEIVQETTEKIIQVKQRMQAARDRQKSYADLKRKPMEFEVGDKVMLKVSPWKGVVRFGKRGKLNPRFVGPFKVIKRVGDVAYKLELPEELSKSQIVEELNGFQAIRFPISQGRWNSQEGPEFTWNFKIISGRNTHICSQSQCQRQELRLKAYEDKALNGGDYNTS
ncbi:hypothetical protein Tco_1031666 [Tanacetum coccineum]|uniref:Tf2-1-like SH3-like domain-containing protein n=1 Tax=Tanacetum coccineum TaxID=301880 RepID=A0ABQ5G9L8_9ASTR